MISQGEDGQRAALRLKFCAPHAMDETSLTLGFHYTIHLDKIRAPRERSVVEQALAQFGGRSLLVQCVLAPPEQSAQGGKSKFEAAAADPVVREALKQGARILDVSQGEA